jgi:mono/diheme cytochrome c family protein
LNGPNLENTRTDAAMVRRSLRHMSHSKLAALHPDWISRSGTNAMKFIPAMFALTAITGSCHYGVADIPNVPDNPTYNGNVYPLYADHCLVCHGSPPNRGAPGYFRLDVYDDANGVSGAKTMAGSALRRVNGKTMPPAAQSGDGVGPNGVQMLQKWVDSGSPQ